MTLITHDTENEMPYNVEFTLTVTVRGKKLEDIDNGLIEAVGARLQARLAKPLAMPNFASSPRSEPQAPAPVPSANMAANLTPQAPAPAAPTGKKRGRPAGWKKPGQNAIVTGSPIEPVATPAHAEPAEMEAEEEIAEVEETPPPAAAVAPSAAATLDDAVQALKLVNSTFNVDKARECLAYFKAARASELPEEQRGAFVAYCRKLCGV